VKIIIFGGGGVGESTAKLLIRHGHHVVIIDRDKEVCERLASDLPEADVLVGQATSPVVLKRAGISNADVFVAVTGSDEANVMSAILAKTMGVKKVIVRVKDPTYVEICKLLGLNEIVNPSESTAIRIDAKIRGLKLAEALEMIEKYIDIEEIAVDERCKYIYCSIEDVLRDLGPAYPILLVHNGKPKIPIDPYTKLEPGDTLLIARKRTKFLV